MSNMIYKRSEKEIEPFIWYMATESNQFAIFAPLKYTKKTI